MSFALNLKNELLQHNLLNHCFYKMWTNGEIKLSTLQDYSKKYLFQVMNLPTYISATHSITEDYKARKILTENLADEELGEKDHVSLWKDFCFGLGISENELNSAKLEGAMAKLVQTCKFYASKSSAAGFGVLYAQEHNYANIATSKKEGLEKHFDMKSEHTNFFSVHEKADVWHAEQVEKLLNTLTESEQAEAKEAGIAVMKGLNAFLDEMLFIENSTTIN